MSQWQREESNLLPGAYETPVQPLHFSAMKAKHFTLARNISVRFFARKATGMDRIRTCGAISGWLTDSPPCQEVWPHLLFSVRHTQGSLKTGK
jgi:hypothetical protein